MSKTHTLPLHPHQASILHNSSDLAYLKHTAIAVAFAAAIIATIALASTVTIAAASTDLSASACLASPDAWACGDNSPSRCSALELEAW